MENNKNVFGIENIQRTIGKIDIEINGTKEFINVLKEEKDKDNKYIIDFFEVRIEKLEQLIIELTDQTKQHINFNIICMNGQAEEIVKDYLPVLKDSLEYPYKKQKTNVEKDEQKDNNEQKTIKKPFNYRDYDTYYY